MAVKAYMETGDEDILKTIQRRCSDGEPEDFPKMQKLVSSMIERDGSFQENAQNLIGSAVMLWMIYLEDKILKVNSNSSLLEILYFAVSSVLNPLFYYSEFEESFINWVSKFKECFHSASEGLQGKEMLACFNGVFYWTMGIRPYVPDGDLMKRKESLVNLFDIPEEGKSFEFDYATTSALYVIMARECGIKMHPIKEKGGWFLIWDYAGERFVIDPTNKGLITKDARLDSVEKMHPKDMMVLYCQGLSQMCQGLNNSTVLLQLLTEKI